MMGADRFHDTADYWQEVTHRININHLQALIFCLIDLLAAWNFLEETVYDQTGWRGEIVERWPDQRRQSIRSSPNPIPEDAQFPVH